MVIFSLAFIVLAVGIGSRSYSIPDEKRYIQSAKEMVESGDIITPRYHGRPRFQKPILTYWMGALSMSLFGKTWFAARLPSALFGASTVLITFLLGSLLYTKRVGFYSAGLLLISEVFFMYSRLFTPDTIVLFFISLTIYFFAKIFFNNRATPYDILIFAALGLGFMTKGLAGLLIPSIIILLFTLTQKKGAAPKKINYLIGVTVFFIITLPWFIAIYKIHGNSYIEHIWQIETVNRVRGILHGNSNLLIGFGKSFLKYISMTFLIFLPAAVFLPATIAGICKRGLKDRSDILLLLWIFTVVLFFSVIGTKKVHYLLAMSPAISIFIGKYLGDMAEEPHPSKIFSAVALTVLVSYLIAVSSALYMMKYLIVSAMPILAWPAIIVSGISVWSIIKGANKKTITLFITSSIAVFIFLFGSLIPAVNDDNGLITLSNKIRSIMAEGDLVGVGSHFISHNRFDSYLGMNVKKVNVDLGNLDEQIRTSKAILEKFLDNDNRVFCVIIREDYESYIKGNGKRDVFVLDKDLYWKKPNQLKLGLDTLTLIVNRDKAGFDRAFKNEIYLISNKRI